jgi:ribosomal protein L7/L12
MGMMLVVLAVIVAVVLVMIMMQGLRTREQIPPEPVDVDWDAAQDEGFQAALERGSKIEAIKIYRQKTGLGLKESKDAVEYYLAGGVPVKKRRQKPSIEGAAGVRDLLSEGRKDEAVELYARFAGVDQYTALDAVEQIEREMRLGDQAKDEGGLTQADRDAIQQFLERGQKIEAIKLYREKTGLGLKESKDAVEDMEKQVKRG